MTTRGFITPDNIIETHQNDRSVFSINIKEESSRDRTVGMKDHKVYYLKVKLNENNSPLQLSPTDTTSRVYSLQKDSTNLKSQRFQKEANKVPNSVIVQMSGDFNLDEPEKSIRKRAAANIKAKLPELDEKEDKFNKLVQGEMIRIGKHKKLCYALKIIDEQFLEWCNQDTTLDELNEYMEFETHNKTSYRGVIQYERKPSSLEKARLKELRQEVGGEKSRSGTEKYHKQSSMLAQQEWGFKINPKTGLVIFDGSKNAGSPIIRLQIGLNASNKSLYLDLYDISHGKQVHHKTGELYYKPATADTGKKYKSGKSNYEKINYDTIADFITPGSLILGMLEFRAVVSHGGVTLKVNLTNELYVRSAKVKRRKEKVDSSLVEEMIELGDNDMYGANSDDEEEEDTEFKEEEAEASPKVDVDLEDDGARSDASDDIYEKSKS